MARRRVGDPPCAELSVGAEGSDRDQLQIARALRNRYDVEPQPDLAALRKFHVLLDPAQWWWWGGVWCKDSQHGGDNPYGCEQHAAHRFSQRSLVLSLLSGWG